MDWKERIVLDPEILSGKPVIRDTRLSVELIIELLAAEWSESDILLNYPGLTHDDLIACLRYASETLKTARIYPMST